MRPPVPAAGPAARRPAEDSEARRPAKVRDAAEQDVVERASIDSFPASDPPGWIS